MTVIKLNKELYSLVNIESCIKDYNGLARFEISEESEGWILSISECLYSESDTAREFENYLIEVTYRSQLTCS